MKYLALGDSYTIGEMIEYSENFPSQLVNIISNNGNEIILDKLIAVTGWTTDELASAIAKEKPTFDYDLVTLLIGVNNQYRGRGIEEYEWQFYSLLCQAVLFAKGKTKNVVVLSIPDWGLTPFNKDRDLQITSAELDALMQLIKKFSAEFGCHYVDITNSTREHAQNVLFLASDLLHYSGQEYKNLG